MKGAIPLFATLLLALSSVGCATGSFTAEAQRALKEAFETKDLDKYTFNIFPRSGVGLLEVYEFSRWKSETKSPPLVVSDSFFRDDLPANEKEQLFQRITTRAAAGRVNFNINKKRDFKLHLAAPELYSAVAAEVSTAAANDVTVDVSASKAEIRELVLIPFKQAIDAGKVDPTVTNLVRSRQVKIVDGAIVLTDYTVTVDLSQVTDTAVQATLGEKFKEVTGTEGKFQLKSSANGRYSFVATEPVVVAKRLKKPSKLLFPEAAPQPG